MLRKEIKDAIIYVVDTIPENENFKRRFQKLMEDALTKTQERSFRDSDLYELIELMNEKEDEIELDFEVDDFEVEVGEDYAD